MDFDYIKNEYIEPLEDFAILRSWYPSIEWDKK